MKQLFLLSLAVFLFNSIALADDNKELSLFDIYASPKAGIGAGSYNATGIDDGHFATLLYGGKLGLKAGPLLLGAEYLEGMSSAESSQPNLSDAQREKYQEPNNEKMRSIGLSAGVYMKRLSLWASFYPQVTLEKNAIIAGQRFEHTYNGTGAGIEAMVRIWDNVHLGIFYNQYDFKKYSSTHASALVDNGGLDPAMKAAAYGLTLSYLIPYSQIQNYIK